MKRVTVIGSGPSGVHFALTALEQGFSVEMIDVGRIAPPAVNPEDAFTDLKSNLDDPGEYFLGRDNEGVLLPGQQDEFYGIPPSKAYALESVPGADIKTQGFEPMVSFARGGLAQLWTGGCYPFNGADLADFPFDYAAIEPWYMQVAERIGINGVKDDLAAAYPFHEGLQDPLRLDEHSELLLARYAAHRDYFRNRLGCSLGRARQAVLSRDLGERKACSYLGRCIWGCPSGSIYTPASSLDECLKSPNFVYHRDYYVTYFDVDDNGRVVTVNADEVNGAGTRKFPVEKLVLACGTLGTSRIFLESVYRKTGEVPRLPGLMDNRQALVPFVNPKMIGRQYRADSYQYNQLAMGLENGAANEYVHCLVTTLKTAMIHPLIERFPVDLRTAVHLFRNIHAALGLVNVNFHDTRRAGSYVTLDMESGAEHPPLQIKYVPPDNESNRIAAVLKRLKKILWRLGCVVPPGMVHIRPMGASVHYAGTLPMSETGSGQWTVSRNCRSHDFDNLYIADGATFPFLPAKNITFTLMANASRVAAGID